MSQPRATRYSPSATGQRRSLCCKRLCRATHGSRELAESSVPPPRLCSAPRRFRASVSTRPRDLGLLCVSPGPAGAWPPGETPLMPMRLPGGTGTSWPGRSALSGRLLGTPSSSSLRGPGAPQGAVGRKGLNPAPAWPLGRAGAQRGAGVLVLGGGTRTAPPQHPWRGTRTPRQHPKRAGDTPGHAAPPSSPITRSCDP